MRNANERCIPEGSAWKGIAKIINFVLITKSFPTLAAILESVTYYKSHQFKNYRRGNYKENGTVC